MDTRRAPPGPMNPAGNAFLMTDTMLASERAARRDLNLAASRKWKVIQPAARNSLGRPPGYLLFPVENSLPYAAPGSAIRRRAGFLDHHLWATRYDPAERYAAGAYVNQSRDGDGLPKWTDDDAPLGNGDLVLWYTLGVTHLPRPEEWPVMPVHPAGFRLLPADFFDRNPALDVPR
jgi:primary-amine oxidase